MDEIVFEPCPELCTILPLQPLRKTKGVLFDSLPIELLGAMAGGERVIHVPGAQSPGPVGDIVRPWYCHRCQDDHLLVFHGSRMVELYHPNCKRNYSFYVTSQEITVNGDILYSGGAILRWKAGVFHRIISSIKVGSASINFAKRYEGFDVRHEFDIHDLDIESGKSRVVRDGYLDQNE